MNARKGNWTIQQLLLDLEARVVELEAANHTVYVHHIHFTAANIDNMLIDITNDTNILFTSDTLKKYLFSLPENIRIMCTGATPASVPIISIKNQGNQIMADLADTDGVTFTAPILISDYVEPIKI